MAFRKSTYVVSLSLIFLMTASYPLSAGYIPQTSSNQNSMVVIKNAFTAGYGVVGPNNSAATCYATISGESAPIGSFEGVLKLEMTSINGNVLRAIPSELTDNNSSFTVSWKSAGP